MNIFKELKFEIMYHYHKALVDYSSAKMLKHIGDKDDSEFKKWDTRNTKHLRKCIKILMNN